MHTATADSLLELPDELLSDILSRLEAKDISRLSRTCHRLLAICNDDHLWHQIIQDMLPSPLRTHEPADSYRELFLTHQPYWFLAQHRIWFDDDWPHGKVIVARYDQRRGCIEAYALSPRQGNAEQKIIRWLDGNMVACNTFKPLMALDLNKPIVSIPLAPRRDISASAGDNRPLEIELSMSNATPFTDNHSSSLSSSLLLTRALPSERHTPQTSLWPPLHIPSLNNDRTYNESASQFRSRGHRPANPSDVSQSTFRVREWIEFGRFSPLANMFSGNARVAEKIRTYATLPRECYTATREKPWQGIWIGDFNAHGCEILLVTQPDDPAPLPRKAKRAWRIWPHNGVRWREGTLVGVNDADSDYNASSDDDDDESASGLSSGGEEVPLPSSDAAHVAETNLAAALEFLEITQGAEHRDIASARRTREQRRAAVLEARRTPFTGRIEGIKLTGDPNVPRGEYTFIAPDLGDAALVGHTTDPVFWDSRAQEFAAAYGVAEQGARVVRSVGHIAEDRFRHDFYIPSQLVLMSGGRLAQYWSDWGHLAFFERFDFDEMMRCFA